MSGSVSRNDLLVPDEKKNLRSGMSGPRSEIRAWQLNSALF
jgi:hypothetical protein